MTKKNKITVMIMIVGAFLAVLNQTTMNPVLPSVMKELNISATTAQWLASGYTLVNAIVVSISAFLMDRFTTRKIFIGAFLFFFVGSVLAGIGLNFPMLLLGRFFQAITIGIMLPMSMTVLLWVFPKEKRGSAMGLYSLVIMFAPAVGPTIAGICTDVIGWRVMFLIMAGLSLAVFLLATIWLENYGEPKNIILDIPSLVLSAIGLFGLLYGFSEIGTNGKLIEALALIIVGVIMLTFFVIRQGKLEKPFLAISVLKDKQFAMGTVISMLIQA